MRKTDNECEWVLEAEACLVESQGLALRNHTYIGTIHVSEPSATNRPQPTPDSFAGLRRFVHVCEYRPIALNAGQYMRLEILRMRAPQSHISLCWDADSSLRHITLSVGLVLLRSSQRAWQKEGVPSLCSVTPHSETVLNLWRHKSLNSTAGLRGN